MRKIEFLQDELESLHIDMEELSNIWEQCNAMYKDENGDVLIPEDTANKISIILGF